MKELVRKEGSGFALEFNVKRGVVWSLHEETDQYGTNYVANEENISDIKFLADPLWLGDVFLKVWAHGKWQKEATSYSSDIRKINIEPDGVWVFYEGQSTHRNGLKKVNIREHFYITDDGLRWDVELINPSEHLLLEVGEVAFPFTMNTDYAALFRGPGQLEDESQRQQEWHERKVMMHLCILGHSSYAIMQRPRGDFPILLFHTIGDTALEAAYQADNAEGSQWDVVWEGPYLLAAHSWARKQERSWHSPREPQRYWINGHTYLLLGPGQSKIFRFRFAFLNSYSEVGETLYRYGHVAVRVQPGMVVPIGQQVNLQLRCKSAPILFPKANDIEIQQIKVNEDSYWYRLRFYSRGQKQIHVKYDNGNRYTNLFFYALPSFEKLLKRRASFIVENHFYDNSSDPYNRHHAFLPYDSMLETLFLDSDEAWQVGGSDEYCLPIAMFLAEKNVYYPNIKEIAALEMYINDFLFRYVQDPDTYEIKRGVYWFEEHPSREPMQWNKQTANLTTRTFNYPLVANIYHAMYRIGKLHGLVKYRTAEDYLNMCFQTAMKWFEIGKYTNYGAPAGSNIVNILDDLRQEDREKYKQLYSRVKQVAQSMEDTPYPFGSELYVDQTAHDQVHALMQYFGKKNKLLQVLEITKALRCGNQPVWFWYGNEKRGNVCCWYAQTLNSRVLLSGFEDTGDHEMLAWAYGGLTSFLTTVQSNGAVRGWFLWWPDRIGFDSRSLDTDLGLYGYLKAAKSYVVDDKDFGLVGYGCTVEQDAKGRWNIVPWDGLRKRLACIPLGIDIAVEKGEISSLTIDPHAHRLDIKLEDSTGLLGEVIFHLVGVNDMVFRVINRGDSSPFVRKNTRGLSARIPLVRRPTITIRVRFEFETNSHAD